MSQAEGGGKPAGTMTIGALVKLLQQDFPGISISKVRYLEEEKLISPRRSSGGYRQFSKADIERLRTILTLQRDEFLPLQVIRKELSHKGTVSVQPAGTRRFKKITLGEASVEERSYTLQEAVEASGADATLIGELEEYGLISGSSTGGVRHYGQTEVEVMAAASDLARYGIEARNLRALKSSVDRESALLLQIVSPSLKSRNPQTRKESIAVLEDLATISSYLKHLLLIKDLRGHTTG